MHSTTHNGQSNRLSAGWALRTLHAVNFKRQKIQGSYKKYNIFFGGIRNYLMSFGITFYSITVDSVYQNSYQLVFCCRSNKYYWIHSNTGRDFFTRAVLAIYSDKVLAVKINLENAIDKFYNVKARLTKFHQANLLLVSKPSQIVFCVLIFFL